MAGIGDSWAFRSQRDAETLVLPCGSVNVRVLLSCRAGINPAPFSNSAEVALSRLNWFQHQLAFGDRYLDQPLRNEPGFSEPVTLKADAGLVAAKSWAEAYLHEADSWKFCV